jgi:hypothetical protein
MNLDDALAGAEMAQQFPVGPSMPFRQPSGPPSNPPSNPPSEPQQQQRSSSGSGSHQQTPRSSGKVSALRLMAWQGYEGAGNVVLLIAHFFEFLRDAGGRGLCRC